MRIVDAFLDLLYPDVTCVACDSEERDKKTLLCSSCEDKLSRRMARETLLEPVAVFCAYNYKDLLRTLVMDFKYNNKRYLQKSLSQLLYTGYKESGFMADEIVPVPLFSKKEKKRGYNQSLLLAKGLSALCGIPCEERLTRLRDTRSQTELSGEKRLSNVKGAFSSEEVSGKHILLIDDVITTGATAGECAKELKRAKAARVSVLTLCI